VDFILEKKPQAHGYTVLKSGASSMFLEKNTGIRGHEFHYSRVCHIDGHPIMAYDVERGSGVDGRADGIVYKNVLAAYTHIHALATPQWAPAMIRNARAHRALRRARGGQGRP